MAPATGAIEEILARLVRAARFAAWTANAAAVATLALTVSILVFEITARFVFNRPTGWSDEGAAYLMPSLVFLAAGQTLLHDGHIRIDTIYSRLSKRLRHWTDLFNETAGLAIMVALVWFSLLMVERVEVSERVASAGTYSFPEYLPRMVVPVGLAVMAFAQFVIWLHAVLAVAAPDRFPGGAEVMLVPVDDSPDRSR